MNKKRFSKWTILAVLSLLAVLVQAVVLPASAKAGPPLICHPIAIGNAKSLPSGDGPFGANGNYDRRRLIEETLELLTPDMPVIVRMETLRRATLYASGIFRGKYVSSGRTEEDKRIANELLSRLMSRTLEANASSKRRAMAWFDVGYLTACYEQAGLAKGSSGYDYVKKALSLVGENPELEFACALMTVWPKRTEHAQHLRNAQAAAIGETLLATNLTLHFGASRNR